MLGGRGDGIGGLEVNPKTAILLKQLKKSFYAYTCASVTQCVVTSLSLCWMPMPNPSHQPQQISSLAFNSLISLLTVFVYFLIILLACLFFPAGVFCAIVSHPADTVVSKLNNDVGSTPIQAARDLGMKGTVNRVLCNFLMVSVITPKI